jgi:hypothetical protein
LLILLDGSKAAAPPVCRVTIDGKAATVESAGSGSGWNASLEHSPEHWLFLRARLPTGAHSLQAELLAPEDALAVSAWLWATERPAPVTSLRARALPLPEILSLDGVRLLEPSAVASAPADPARVPRLIERSEGVFLDTLEPTSAAQGWGTLQRNRSVTERPIVIAGRRYLRGLGTHSPSRITYALDGNWRRFQAWAGADDATSSTVTFEVHVDGQKRWESGLMMRGTPAKRVDVDVSGAQTLELIVGDGGNTYTSDHADWADARLLR